MYRVPMKISFDGYKIPSLNDGWYPTSLKDYSKQIYIAWSISGDKLLYKQVCAIVRNDPKSLDIAELLLHQKKDQNNLRRDYYFKQQDGLCMGRHLAVIRDPVGMILKSGSIVPSHMHHDALSIQITGFSEDLGTPGYGSSINESWYRNSLSHNCISINGGQPHHMFYNIVKKRKYGYKASVKGRWGKRILIAERMLEEQGHTVKDVSRIVTCNQHRFEWTLHFEYEIRMIDCKRKRTEAFSQDASYIFFNDVEEVFFDNRLTIECDGINGETLQVVIPHIPGSEVYIAKTPSNPANRKRNTIIIRRYGRTAEFVAYYSISKNKDSK